MKSHNLSGVYESPVVSAIEFSTEGILCSSVENTFSTTSLEEFTRQEFTW